MLSLWLFNVFIDGVLREVNVRLLERGLNLIKESLAGISTTAENEGVAMVLLGRRVDNANFV